MPLPQFYKFVAVNNTGETLIYNDGGRLNLKKTGWKWDTTNGDVVYTNLSNEDFGFGTDNITASSGENITPLIDNSTNEYVGVQVQLEVTHPSGSYANGRYDLYLDGAPASGTLMSDATGYINAETNVLDLVGSLVWHGSADNGDLMRSPVFEVE